MKCSKKRYLISSVRCFSPVILGLIAIAAGLTALAGCSQEKQAGAKTMVQRTIPVTAARAMKKDIPVVLRAIGSVEAYNTVSIRSRTGGALTEVAFQEGQDVREGDLLFVIDPRPYQAALQSALATLDKDRAQAASAETDAKRYAELIEKGFVARQQYDQVTANAQALKALVRADESAVEAARLNLQYCRIRAPISGRTGNLRVHQGDQIKADDIAMVVINQISPIKVNFSVPEQHLTDIRTYQQAGSLAVEAGFPNDPGKPVKGKLTFIDNIVDSSTRTILLKATFPNADRRLWPGQFVNVSLQLTTRRGAVVVPSQAIQPGQEGVFVFVIKPDGTAESRTILPGQEVDGEIVVEKGLEAGEQVVTDGQLRLAPGAKVEVQPGRGAES